MKCILIKDDGSQETIDYFVLIKCNREPGNGGCITECISSIKDPLYRADLLGDHSRWEYQKVKI